MNSNLRNAWKTISGLFNDRLHLDRTPKQCRDRWLNFLEPSLTNLELTENDINKLFKLQKELGNKWSRISEEFPGRSENLLKNAFYSTIRRNIRKFNKKKHDNQRIRGKIDKLLLIPEVRSILETDRSWPVQHFMAKRLSVETLYLIQKINENTAASLANEIAEENDADNMISIPSP